MEKGMDHQGRLVSLRRIEGQIRGVQKMIGERRYCMDILRALGAAAGALKSVEAEILKTHLNACVKHAVEGSSKKAKDAKLDEVYEFFKGFR